MAFARSENFEARHLQVADCARVLGHPARVALVEILAGRQTCTCGELVEELPLAQATVSQHLKVLKEAALVQGTIDGPRSCYCIDREQLRRVMSLLENWLEAVKETDICC